MRLFNAAKKTAADLTWDRGRSTSANATQIIFEVALIGFLCAYAPIGVCLALMVGFLASTAYNMCAYDTPKLAA
ncbi:MAG: hypothetical protein P1U32_03495 [Legionellaceae bacterium]|nr:hypothetical protein [Legionellaceae bacterium]